MKIIMAILLLMIGFSGSAIASVQLDQQSIPTKIILADIDGDLIPADYEPSQDSTDNMTEGYPS